jgi:xylan 1,4-beta-xylosidase
MDPLRRRNFTVLLALIAVASMLHAASAEVETITIDASKGTGTIKRLNDLDNGPLCQHGIVDLTRYYKELEVRNVRLHDVPWSYADVLDMEYVFPNWDADPERKESYNFTESDHYIKTITDLGINIIFRIGYSAEGKMAVRHNTPAPSYEKWAAVAEHIVRHYNQGWANGVHANIRYWEIWNEPDGAEFWSGTPEEYFRLYEVTAKALKKVDGSLLVGGPALAGNLNFLEGFLKYSQQHQVPIDFVSWHIYTRNPADAVSRGQTIKRLVSQFGYPDAESVLDEWNYAPASWGSLFVNGDATRSYFDATQDSTGAAFDAAMLIALEDAQVDIATFYTGTTAIWGLFTAAGVPQKPYFAFLAFSELLRSPNRLAQTMAAGSNLRAIAGISEDRRTVRVLISNPSAEAKSVRLVLSGLPWKGSAQLSERVVDGKANFSLEGAPRKINESTIEEKMGPNSVLLVTIEGA